VLASDLNKCTRNEKGTSGVLLGSADRKPVRWLAKSVVSRDRAVTLERTGFEPAERTVGMVIDIDRSKDDLLVKPKPNRSFDKNPKLVDPLDANERPVKSLKRANQTTLAPYATKKPPTSDVT
jgi:hypothetical protein